MKKLVMTILTVLTCGAAYALPVGNPSDASLLCDGLFFEGHCGDYCDPCLRWCDAFSARLGFYGDYVFNRHLEVGNHHSHGPDIEHTRLYTNAGLIVANFWDRVDLFSTLGTTSLFIDTNASAFGGVPGNRYEIETATAFSWSVGGRATLWECGCTTLGVEGQYFRTNPHVTRVTQAAELSNYFGHLHARYSEWQVGLGVAHRINIFAPYAAVKYSRAHLEWDGDTVIVVPASTLDDLHAKKHWGYEIGLSLVDCEKTSLTLAARFGDETAAHVNFEIRI